MQGAAAPCQPPTAAAVAATAAWSPQQPAGQPRAPRGQQEQHGHGLNLWYHTRYYLLGLIHFYFFFFGVGGFGGVGDRGNLRARFSFLFGEKKKKS